jgi:hypothetical protein
LRQIHRLKDDEKTMKMKVFVRLTTPYK